MKTPSLLLTALLSGAMLAGCIDLSSDDKEELSQAAAAFLDGYEEEQNEDVSTSEALEKNYLEEGEVTESSAVGSARIGGEIDVASLNRSLAKISSRSMGSRAQLAARAVDTLSASNFSVSFINGKGQLVELTISTSDILIHQPATGNPQFIIEGMGDGINYIIEIMVTVDGGEPIDLKTLAFVPTGETKSEKAVLDPISTVITEAIKDKVVNSFFETGGDTLAQSYIADLTETLIVSIEEAITDNPNLSASDFEDALEVKEGSETGETGIDDLVAKLLSDEDIAGDLNKIEDAAVADTFAVPDTVEDTVEGNKNARTIVEDLFNQDSDGGDDGTPQFIIDFFADQFVADKKRTIEALFNSILQGVDIDPDTEIDTGLDLSFYDNADNALNAFTTELNDIYAAIDTVATLEAKESLSEAEENELQNLRNDLSSLNLLLGIFPPENKTVWQALSPENEFTVPQAITLIFYTLDTFLEPLKGFERNEDGQVEESDGVDFDPSHLLALYGLILDETDINYDPDQFNEYANLAVNWLDLHPGRVWLSDVNNGAGGEVDILNLFTCVDAFPEENFDVASITLTYPKKDGTTGSIELKNESDLNGDNNQGGDDSVADDENNEGDHKSSCFTLNPWTEADILANSGNPEYGSDDQQGGGLNYDAIWRDLVDSGVAVTDFASGSYSLAVVYSEADAANISKTFAFDKRIITGLSSLFPEFDSPNGFPRFPEGNASPEDYAAFDEAVRIFTITTYPAVETTVAIFEGGNTSTEIRNVPAAVNLSWNEPALLATTPLPEGVIAVYNLDIGRDVCFENADNGYNECQWQHVFSSWETGSQIFDTQFELPDEAREKLTELTLSDTPYQANLNIDFIDENTGEFLGSGGWAQAPFRVGEVLNLTDTFDLTGTVTGAPDLNQYIPGSNDTYPITDYKVAAVKESCLEDTDAEPFTGSYTDEEGNLIEVDFFPWVCTSETLAISNLTDDGDGGHSYTLQPTLQAMMGNNQNSWIDVRMFIDTQEEGEDGFGVIDQGTAENFYQGEPQFWSSSHVNFNNWGGVLRISSDNCDSNGCNYSEEIVLPEESYPGPNFELGNEGHQGNGDGNDDGGDKNIYAFFTVNEVFLDTTLTWDLDASLPESDVDMFEVVLAEIQPTTGDAVPLAALVLKVPGDLRSISISNMLSPSTGMVDITAEAIAEENAEKGSSIVTLTDVTLTDDKVYVWFIEALDVNGDSIGESHDVMLNPAPPTSTP